MSVPNLPADIETTAEPTEVVVRRLVRALDYAKGFWLGFVKCNVPAQRRKAIAACKELLEPLKVRVVEVEITKPAVDLLPVLKACVADARVEMDSQQKVALFVHGLEYSISSSDAYPPILSYLNFNRELFRQELPCPLVIWLPDYALTALARRAPDFWAWRSGFYEIAPEEEMAERAFEPIQREEMHVTSSLSEQAKRGRLTMLKGLLADYCELGNGPHERRVQSDILNRIGLTHFDLGEWADAKQAFEKSLAVARDNRYQAGIATPLHNLGMLAYGTGDYAEAQRLYDESLKIRRELGDTAGVARTLNELGTLAWKKGDYAEARRLYDESIKIERELGNLTGEAISLHNLGMLAYGTGDYAEAQRLYKESLKIKRELGDTAGEAISLHNLGALAQVIGDYAEARRLYKESLKISRDLGDIEGTALSLIQLALFDEEEGKYKEAVEQARQAEEIFLRLGNPQYIAHIKAQRQRLEKKAAAES